MKSVIPTITVLTVFSLAIVSSVSAQNAREKEYEAVKEVLGAAQMARIDVESAIREADADDARMAEKMQIEKVILDLNLQSVRLQEQGVCGTILVVPTAEMKAEDFAVIMQDMNIMTRILDKKINYPLRLGEGETVVLGGWSTSGRYKQFISGQDKATKSIYVQDYGALFFIKVNFPLSPPREVTLEKIKEGVDPVWEDTKQEIYSSKEARATILASSGAAYNELLKNLRTRTSRLSEYDAEKVEELKRKLTKTLKHAANIRSLKPQDWVVLAVTGKTQPVVITEILVEENDEAGKTKTIRVTPQIQEAEPAWSTVLTIRVKKSDVDAFSKGELDFDRFRERTRILTSRARLGGQQRSDIQYLLSGEASKLLK